MPWNLVEELSAPGERRAFYLPLAGIPPGGEEVRDVNPNQFDLTDEHTFYGPQLNIRVTPPTGGFIEEDDLPDPTIRLHAIARGRLWFLAADDASSMENRLVLEVLAFSTISQRTRWWQRWVEADSIPMWVIYENVDVDHLDTLIRSLPEAEETYGLSLPEGFEGDTAAAEAYVDNFLTGTGNANLVAQAGAYIGRAGLAPDAPDTRLLKLHARYSNHLSDDIPTGGTGAEVHHPMNPRELFYLLFGDESREAHPDDGHPLLRRMESIGQGQAGIHPESKRMLLRPPLRTWKRVVWEAEQEINNHQANWTPGGTLGSDRFYNNHSREGRSFGDGPCTGNDKCNLFVSDICLRAGFRVAIFPVGASVWHYIRANNYTNLAHIEDGDDDRIALSGVEEDESQHWGWKIDNWIAAQDPPNTRHQKLNERMHEEGRCFIVAGARPRRFKSGARSASSAADCRNELSKGVGHIVIIREVLDPPPDWNANPEFADPASPGEGLQRIRVRTMEASGNGAESREIKLHLGGAVASPDGPGGFIRLHLIELAPGSDPDTPRGLRDLNVRCSFRNHLRTRNERANPLRITSGPQSGQCCIDHWPGSPNITLGSCP